MNVRQRKKLTARLMASLLRADLPAVLALLLVPHTGAVQVAGEVWHVGFPLVVVAACVTALLLALLHRGEPSAVSRRDWLGGLVLLSLAGDAALGDHRPSFERQWKGTAAALLGLALGIHLWRHYRYRGRSRSRTPEALPTRLDGQGTGAVGGMQLTGEVAWAEDALAAGEATVLAMPALGESVTEGTVIRWLKQVGDAVEADEPLLEISTDKVDTEIPSPAAGTLLEVKAVQGETVPTGATLAVIGLPRVQPRK